VPALWERIRRATLGLTHGRPIAGNGASPSALAELEAAVGAKLPDDLRASYLLHNGQPQGAPALFPHEYGDLGCGYWLLSVEGILRDWGVWKDLNDGGEFSGLTAIPDEGVRSDWWHPGWLPIAADGGGDFLCVDLAPDAGGTMGQVIQMCHDDGKRPRLAASFAQVLAQLAEHYEKVG
jgi:cell wall assembly regulator SMI1